MFIQTLLVCKHSKANQVIHTVLIVHTDGKHLKKKDHSSLFIAAIKATKNSMHSTNNSMKFKLDLFFTCQEIKKKKSYNFQAVKYYL